MTSPNKSENKADILIAVVIGCAVLVIVALMRFGGEMPPPEASVVQPDKARAPVAAPPGNVAQTKEVRSAEKEPMGDVAYLSIESDKSAIIYIGDKKAGITPLKHVQIAEGEHRVLAMDMETGARKSATAVVSRGEDRVVRFEFR